MSFTREFFRRSQAILLKCAEFDTPHGLDSIFSVVELAPFKDGLPQGSTKQERVANTLAYLQSCKLRNHGSILPIFLGVLRDSHDEEDQLHADLDELLGAVSEPAIEPIMLPYVVVAISRALGADASPSLGVPFLSLESVLPEHYLTLLRQQYGDHPDQWRPYPSAEPIEDIIEDIAEDLNEYHRKPLSLPPILPVSFTDRILSSDKQTKTQAQLLLERSGGIVIIDAISMLDSFLAQRVANCEFGSMKRVAILVVSPGHFSQSPTDLMTQDIMEKHMERVLIRYATELDPLCEVGVSDLRVLKRWLYSTIPDTAAAILKRGPNRENVTTWKADTGHIPTGIYHAFGLGLGGAR